MALYDRSIVGGRVRRLREEKHWTRSEFAENLDVSDRFCSSIELGQKGMAITTLLKVTEVLGTSTDYVLTGVDLLVERPAEYVQAVGLLDRCPAEKLPFLEDMVLSYLLSLEREPEEIPPVNPRKRAKKKEGRKPAKKQRPGVQKKK